MPEQLRAIMIACAVFIALNPFMTAHPAGPLPPQLQAIAEMSPGNDFVFWSSTVASYPSSSR